MSSTDALPDREALRANALANQRKGRRVVFIVLAVLVLFSVLSSFAFSGPRSWSAAEIAVTALPILLAVSLTVLATRAWRRQDRDPQLSLGADRETQRAVARALRDGGTTDPRVDALARDAAERSKGRAWLIWLYGLLTAVFTALLIRNVMAGGDWFTIAAFALPMMAQALLMYTFWQLRRRAVRYLRGAGRGRRS